MSKKDAVVLAGRTLALFLTMWALSEVSYLPEFLHSFLRYMSQDPRSSDAIQYWRHYYVIRLAFLVTGIIGFSLMARWLYQGGPEVEALLSGDAPQENAVQN
jgi:hypothetical protein